MFKATLKGITRAVSGNGAINQDEGQGAQRGLLMHRQGLETHIFMFYPDSFNCNQDITKISVGLPLPCQLIKNEKTSFTQR